MTDFASALGDWSMGRGPLYHKLFVGLRDLIERGILSAGTRLPSERAFARDLAVSRATVVAAYDGLRSAALVESRHGSGTRVLAWASRGRGEDPPSLGTPVFRRLLAGPDDALISFACAAIPGPNAIADAVRTYPAEELKALLCDTGYVPRGLPALREALAALTTADGLDTTADQILVTTGAHQAITLCASLFVRPGDLVLVENPTYPGCADAFAAAGARLVSLPVDRNGMVVDNLERLLTNSPVAAIFVIPTFQNPTGSVMAGYRRRHMAEVAGRLEVPVIEDNALSHARIGPVELPIPIGSYPGAERAPVITVGSLSKALWGGLRVGWLRAPQPWLERLARRKVATDLGSGVLDQAVATRLLANLPELEDANSRLLRDRLAATEHLLAAHLPDWTWDRPAGGPALWVKLPYDAGPFCQLALRHGVEVVPGATFGTEGTFADHVRIPFTADPTVMAEAIQRLAAADADLLDGRRCAEEECRPRLVV